MATTRSNRNTCDVCGKSKGISKCAGCEKIFCYNHFGNHRQELYEQLDEIKISRDLFRQTLGVIVDQFGTIYVADYGNNRVMRWCKGASEGSIVVSGNRQGAQPNQFHYLQDISLDRQGNLYVVDQSNHRVQRFDID